MANLKIKTLGVPGSLADKLAHNKIICVKDFLLLSYTELQRKTGLSFQKLVSIHTTINTFVAPQPVPASQLNCPQFVKFHNHLDIFLRGGVRKGQITEFAGAPGLGKTQFCLQLALSNALAEEFNGVLYIDTEGAFSPERLLEIAVNRFGLNTQEKVEICLKRILVWKPKNFQEFLKRLSDIEIILIKQKVGLLIIDSMGSVIRRQYGAEQSVERGEKLCSLSSYLKNVAHILSIAVIVTNHVTTAYSKTGGQSLIPALGPSWSHWINNRLYLKMSHNQRQVIIAKSPDLPELAVNYQVSARGIDLVDDPI